MLTGAYFGEIEIINKTPRNFTTSASQCCEFLTLSKQIFETYVIEEYTEILQEMREVAYQREILIKAAKRRAQESVKRMIEIDLNTDHLSEFLISDDTEEER